MDKTARLPLGARRWQRFAKTFSIRGVDLTGADLRMQLRLYPNAPGAPLVDLLTVANGNAQGLRLVSVAMDGDVPVSTIEAVINETTIEELPFAGEAGGDTVLAYDLQVNPAGGYKAVWIEGEFWVLAAVTGADGAPDTGTMYDGTRRARPNFTPGTTMFQIGDSIVDVTIGGGSGPKGDDGKDAVIRRVDFDVPAGGQDRFHIPFLIDEETLLPIVNTVPITDRAAYAFDSEAGDVVFVDPIAAGSTVVFYSALLNAPMINTGRGRCSVRDFGGHQDNPDNSAAFASMWERARIDGLTEVEDPQYEYKTGRISVPPGAGGIVGLKFCPVDGGTESGIYAGGQEAGFDKNLTDALFESIRFDGRRLTGNPLKIVSGQRIRILDLHASNLVGAGAIGIDLSALATADHDGEDVVVEDCIIDGTPLGTPSANNYGIGIGINVAGQQGAPLYTDLGTYQEMVRDPETGETSLVTRAYQPAEATWRQLAQPLPTPRKMYGVKVRNSKFWYSFYGSASSGAADFEFTDNDFFFNIRSTDNSNGSVNGRFLRNLFREYSSVGALASYGVADMEYAFNRYRSNRCAGAAAFEAIHGINRFRIHNEDIVGIRNDEPGNPDGVAGAIPVALIALSTDLTDIEIYECLLRGSYGLAAIDISGAFGVTPSAEYPYPEHFGRFRGENNARMAHIPSTGIKIYRNPIGGDENLPRPAINVTSITNEDGIFRVLADIGDNSLTDATRTVMLRTQGMSAPDDVEIENLVGNSGVGGGPVAMAIDAHTNVINREGNAGDPGSDAVAEGSVGSLPRPFPPGQIRRPVDLAVGAGIAVSNGRDWRDSAGNLAAASVAIAGYTGTNVTRTGNTFAKTTPDGQFDALWHSTGTFAAATALETEMIVRAGSLASMGFNSVAAASIAQTALGIAATDGGDLLAYYGGEFFQALRLRTVADDKVIYRPEPAGSTWFLVLVGDRSMYTPLSSLPAGNVYAEGTIHSGLQDLTYVGPARALPPGLPLFTTKPTITVLEGGAATVGKTLVFTDGTVTNVKRQRRQWLRGLADIPLATGSQYILTDADVTGSIDQNGYTVGTITCVQLGTGPNGQAQAMPAGIVVTA